MLVENGLFTVNGVKMEYDRSLCFSCDCPDLTMPETVEMSSAWDCEKLYRVKLTAPLNANEEYRYVLKVTE